MVTRTVSYDEYGAVAAHTGSGTSAIGYTGSWTDPTTGLVYLRARDYDPATGQFLSVDPALAHTHQPYSYTGNDPVGAVDLTGLCPVNGGANVADCTAEDFGANPFFLSPFALAIGDALNSPVGRAVSSVLEGIGDGSSFGLTGQLRQALGVDCYVERNASYYGGLATGVVASSAALGLGVSAAATRIGSAGKFLDYTTETANGGIGGGEVGGNVGRTLTVSEQRSVFSLQRQVAVHMEKLDSYRSNPDAYDNLGMLQRAPTLEIRERIIDSRINHLETEIHGFQAQINKLLGGG